jgi:acetyl esterase/lipase
MRIQKNIAYGNGLEERQTLDVILPDGEMHDLLVYFHGGGLEGGSKEEVNFLYGLADKGIGLIVPNYRLYPKVRYPEFILDAATASAWAVKFRDSHYPGSRLFLTGSSAGAYLAMMLCFDARYLAVHKIEPDVFAGFIFDAGQPTVHYHVLLEAGFPAQAVVVDERAPIFHVREEPSYPPMLFLCAEKDMPGRFEQTLLMLSVLKNFGHCDKVSFRHMEGYQHCEYDDKPVFQELILKFISEHSGNRSRPRTRSQLI